jgi:lipopolysaccharide/colanic/teichoic acid biosynthesis glycosyltransferase
MPIYPRVKRFLDVVLGASVLLACLPLLTLAALLVKLESPGPVLFVQRRLGRHGKLFWLYKFRSMYHQPRMAARQVYAGDPEVTRMGRVLRRLKIDELPQLWNVLKGDMSLVGPRPALPEQLAELTGVAARRLEVRPGLTGLAQVKGNILLSWPRRWRYDVVYVQRLSLALDGWIVLRTLLVLVCGEQFFLRPSSRRMEASTP